MALFWPVYNYLLSYASKFKTLASEKTTRERLEKTKQSLHHNFHWFESQNNFTMYYFTDLIIFLIGSLVAMVTDTPTSIKN